MDTDDLIGGMLVFFSITCVLITITFLCFDFRLFSDVAKQCEARGFIQDNNVRINCSLEKK